jgi:glutathionyl-hydroquinone reductase
MGKLVSGQWHDVWYDTASTQGAFLRDASAFRRRVTADGSSGLRAEAGRYHLYVSRACPWAHRTLIFRALKGLEHVISISVVHPHMGKDGWTFDEAPGTVPDTVNGVRALHEIYTLAKPDYTGRVTVPVLWDRSERTIVNNESSEIIRMLNREFDALATRGQPDFYPADLAADIDALNTSSTAP